MYNSLIKSASRCLAVIEFFTHQYLEEKEKIVHVGTLLKCMLLMLLDACYVESLCITAMFLLKYC